MKITSSPAVCSRTPCSARLLILSFNITSWWVASCVPRSEPFCSNTPVLTRLDFFIFSVWVSLRQQALCSVRGQRLSKWGLPTPEELPAESPTTSRIIRFTTCRPSLNTGTQRLLVFVVVLRRRKKKLSAKMAQSSSFWSKNDLSLIWIRGSWCVLGGRNDLKDT